MNEAHISAQQDFEGRPWGVELAAIRCRDAGQRKVLADLGPLVFDVIRLFLKSTMPDARVLEPHGSPVRHILFSRRSDMRRFIQVWGGRRIATPSSA